MKYKYLFIDLDGTMVDSGPGIVRSVEYALQQLGEPTEPLENYYKFIGPPLTHSFREFCGFDAERSEEAIRLFRVYYDRQGKLESSVFPGIHETLSTLVERGYILSVASTKKEYFARQVMEHFDLLKYFTYVSCADDVVYVSKADVIDHAMRELGADPSEVLMIGDRIYDIEGARECGVDVLGVTYSYGSPEEMSVADMTAASPLEILSLID